MCMCVFLPAAGCPNFLREKTHQPPTTHTATENPPATPPQMLRRHSVSKMVVLTLLGLSMVQPAAGRSLCSYWCTPGSLNLLCTRVCNDLKYHLDHIQHLISLNQQLEHDFAALVLLPPPLLPLATVVVCAPTTTTTTITEQSSDASSYMLLYTDTQTQLDACLSAHRDTLLSLADVDEEMTTLTRHHTQLLTHSQMLIHGTWVLASIIGLLLLRLCCVRF